jgi:hypothetical protein
MKELEEERKGLEQLSESEIVQNKQNYENLL